jgi:hypothetical protein
MSQGSERRKKEAMNWREAHSKVGVAAVMSSIAEVDCDGFGVSDVEVAVTMNE